jgi:hypothetical protein
MKTRLLMLFFALAIFTLVFVWGTTNYMIRYTDTPSELPPELYVQNIDVFAIPAVFEAFAIMSIIPAIVFVILKYNKWRIVLVPLSGTGMFFIFYSIL